MKKIHLTLSVQLEEVLHESKSEPVVIFKHSTRCSISSVAKSRLESNWDFDIKQLPIYYLDLISYRNISNLIADNFEIEHESPQLILIKNGKCIYHQSHMSISVSDLRWELEI